MRRQMRAWCIVVVGALTVACATPTGVELPEGTLVLGEVRQVLTRALVDAGEVGPGEKRENLASSLNRQGYSDDQIDAGRVVMVRDQIYWNNTVSGIKHSTLKFTLLAQAMTVEPGNVVEVTLGGKPALVISRVRARSLAEGGCYYGEVPVGTTVEALGALSLVGPRGSATLYCAGIEQEGWQRPRTYWHKLPGAVAGGTAASTSPPTPVALDGPAPEPVPGADGMATLMLFRNRALAASWFDLPVWVDGEKIANLAEGQCDLVLLAPGDHVVTAGTRTTELFGFPERELRVSMQAGQRAIVEWVTDQKRLDALGMASLLTPREQWEREVFRFAQRPATPTDACAIRHAPTVLRGVAPAGADRLP